MRVALISDIHGNRIALDAALADIERDRPDQIVCLGDVAATGPQPCEVVERLRSIQARFVMGNADGWMLDPQPWEIKDEDSRILLEIELWGAQQLSPADLDFLRTFQPTVELALPDDITLLCYHGSPRSNMDEIRSSTPDDTLDSILSGYHAAVMAGGHTHTKMLRCHRDSLIVNPGSVGLPIIERAGRMRNPLWAEYALMACDEGSLSVEFRRVPVSLEALTQAALASGMPHAQTWLRDWG